ncbi:hypothetical protein [Streptomyces brasiliensis]|uniref:Uncharacterized protein n=1 Tax=Streptomyces brasiliensis TaxID=1954 RepID=A0A917P408_9ACTN|nr:hypothetical protein [Streptomyces brasiliensis]GGJ60563.1 hypothetical protein GCM10010121_083980 [Streptomyces brasiliensis]
MCVLAIQTSWEALQNAGEIPRNVMMPAIQPVRAKQRKLLRAEPIAQQMVQDKVGFRGVFTDMEREWATWQSTDPGSPSRIEAPRRCGQGGEHERVQGRSVVRGPI